MKLNRHINKVAVIGSGISGLTTAHLLSRKHNITLFEKNDYIGGHTHTHSIEEEGTIYNVDSGFIVYNENTYPNFIEKTGKKQGFRCMFYFYFLKKNVFLI